MRKKLLTAVIAVSCRHSISRIAQSVLATPTTIHFVEISGWSTHDTMNYSDAPAKLDELQASQQQGNLFEHAQDKTAWTRGNCVCLREI